MIKTPPHTKVRTVRTEPNGRKVIDSHSVYEELSSTQQEIQQTVQTSFETLAADLIACSELIRKGDTPELTLRITTDKKSGNPNFIVKTWTVDKEYYGR
jgi:hypothetical protein